MSFFDDLEKKINKAGKTAVQKTKEMANVAKLNSAISDEEKRIDDNYLQIGKLYVSLHDAEHEADFDAFIAAIHESEGKIKEYKQQIKDIKGIVKCEKCGAEVSKEAAFCSACGAPMPKEEPVAAEQPIEETPVAVAQPIEETPVAEAQEIASEPVQETNTEEPAQQE